jgi:hypothetical protein
MPRAWRCRRQARLPGGDRDADDDAADQDRGGARRGGEVVLAGDSYDDAYTHALELEKSREADLRPSLSTIPT